MKTEIRERWTAELRSGKYEQGKNFLATTDGKFCCLGVLCRIAVEEGVITEGEHVGISADGAALIGFGPRREARVLPLEVQRWAGLYGSSPHIPLEAVGDSPKAAHAVSQSKMGGYDHINLATLNDAGVPFTEIADLIDANFPDVTDSAEIPEEVNA